MTTIKIYEQGVSISNLVSSTINITDNIICDIIPEYHFYDHTCVFNFTIIYLKRTGNIRKSYNITYTQNDIYDAIKNNIDILKFYINRLIPNIKQNITKLTERNAKGKLVEYHIIDYDSSKLLKEQVFKCPYTKQHFLFNDGILLGTILHSECFIYPFSVFCHSSANIEYKLQKLQFDEFKKNCNTCLLLERIKTTDKSLKGRCSILETKHNHPYLKNDYFDIYPSDNMSIINEQCYTSRNNSDDMRIISNDKIE